MSSTATVTVEISEIYASDFYEWSQTDCEGDNYRNDQSYLFLYVAVKKGVLADPAPVW